MKALVQKRYGSIDELEVRDVPLPSAGRGEVRVRVRATSMHADIWHVVSGRPFVLRCMGAGLWKPKSLAIPGTDVAGVVDSVGPGVSEFAEGDRVFGEVVADFQWKHGGTYAEYVCAKATELVTLPDGASFEEAATVPTSAKIALRSLRESGELAAGQQVLINGAGGNVGRFAVQIAKARGARVTAVDCAEKLEMLRSLGAEHAIDYREQPVRELTESYDVILDVASNLRFLACRKLLKPDGKYVFVGHDHFGRKGRSWLGSVPQALGLMALSPFFRQLPKLRSQFDQRGLLHELQSLLEKRALTPLIERAYSLDEVPIAYRRMLSGEAQGYLVITP